MTEASTDLTPPVKSPKRAANGMTATQEASVAKPPKAAKEPKAPKEPKVKAEKAPVDPNAPKKPRAPRTDYGFSPDSTISIVKEKEHGYRGQRLEWFNRISGYDGKTTAEFLKDFDNATTPKGSEDPPRGWVRFFVQEGSVKLIKAPAVEQVAA